MKDIVEQSQTTTWEHSFGASLTTSFSAGVPLVGETSFSISLSYNFKTGGSSTVTSKQEVLEKFQVEIYWIKVVIRFYPTQGPI